MQLTTNHSSLTTGACANTPPRHEQEHIDIYAEFGIPITAIPTTSPDETDGDGIPNAHETTHEYGGFKTDPTKRDTYNLYDKFLKPNIYNLSGDQELRCFRKEEDNTSKYQAYPTKDWSSPGAQHFLDFEAD